MTTVGTPVAAVRVPARSALGELRAIKIVWQRELIRFADDRMRMITSVVQPFAFLFILGAGLSSLTSASTGGGNPQTVMYPRILAMSGLFTAIFSAPSICWGPGVGFLAGMLGAPGARSS